MNLTVTLSEKIELTPKELRILRQLTERSKDYLVGATAEVIASLSRKNLINDTHTYHGSNFDKWANCKALRKSAIVTHRMMRKVYLNFRGDRVVAILKKRGW